MDDGIPKGDIFKIQKLTKFFGFLFSPRGKRENRSSNFVNGVLFSSL